MSNNSNKRKQVAWHVTDDLRERVNTKAWLRKQAVDDFVAEVMELNTEDVKHLQERYVKERRSGLKGIRATLASESKSSR